ncbi:MAG: tail fiber domain-containing protein [Candidatus Krumholzibacteria bacterium]|nr:tail fiber domain-containing protein [Candidatus Krumholzibacteria bacterium]
MSRSLLLSAIVVACFAVSAVGEVPPIINYQGVLTDGAGTPVPDATYDITFALYYQETGGSAFWTQTMPVFVSGGIFNVTLGDFSNEPFENPSFLGITIGGGQEMTPRRMLTSAPYALNARTVQDNAIHAFKIANGTVVRSLNGITDDVNLSAGANITINPTGSDIVISASGGGGVGGTGAAGQVAFWSDASTLSGENNLFWDSLNDRLGIGTPNPNGRLRVESSELYTTVIAGDRLDNNTQVLRVNFTGTGDADPVAVYGQSRPADSRGIGGEFVGGYTGVRAYANVGNQVQDSYGLHAEAIGSGGNNRFGVLAEASGPGVIRCYGLMAEGKSATATYTAGAVGYTSNGSGYRYGVSGYVDAGGLGYYGVFGDALISGASSAVYAAGDLTYTGNLIGPPSDARLKKDVQPYEGALSSIMQMETKTFQYKLDDPQFAGIRMAPGKHYGLLAQDLETVLPELVVERVHPKSPMSEDDGASPPLTIKGIKYMELVPILVQAIKEQQQTIEKLEARVGELEKK